MSDLRRTIFQVLVFGVFLQAGAAMANTPLFERIADLSENQWGFLSTNSFRDAWPEPAQYQFENASGTTSNPSGIIRAHSSFAWDSTRDQLTIFGGGHSIYAGNDIYLWDGNTGAWERGSLPSEVQHVGGLTYTAIDGPDHAPASAHTYDNNIYLPIADRFVVFGGAAWNSGRGHFVDADGQRQGPYFWDPSKADPNKVGGTTGSQVRPETYDVEGGEMWENRHAPLPATIGRGHESGVTAYAEEGGKDVVYVDTTHSLWRYTVHDVNDASQDEWEQVGDRGSLGAIWFQGAGALDAGSSLFVRTSGSQFFFYDLSQAGNGSLASPIEFIPEILGDTQLDFSKLGLSGLDYDPVRDRFLLWSWESNGGVWELTEPDILGDPWHIRLIDALPSDHGFPDTTQATVGGILGKWEYIPDYDIFLGLYDHIDGGVWAFKPENWSPALQTVPLPPAAWLFGSAFALLIGRRRMKSGAGAK